LGTTHLHETILEYEAIFQLKNHMLLHWFTPSTLLDNVAIQQWNRSYVQFLLIFVYMPVVQSNCHLMHLMISSIAMALHSQKLGQTIWSKWPPQVMSTLQWHHHTQTNLLWIAPAIQYYIKPDGEQKNKIQQFNSTVTLNLKPNA
jgi:hypothetical protein